MIVTEEEAKTKRCQESFGNEYRTPNGNEATVSMNPFGHQWSSGIAAHASPSHCIGSACMAWRWENSVSIRHGENPSPTSRGFCGKAGA